MTTRVAILLVFILLFAFGCAGKSEPSPELSDAANAAAVQRGLDARLTGYDYPYPVQIFETTSQNQRVEMAFMDVPADGLAKGAVLLLHGKNFSGAYWARTIDTLTRDGYRVIAPDQIGFGKSSKPMDFQYSFHQLAALTHELLEELGIHEAAVVGHSMGGMVATRYALMYPKGTTSLTLVNPIGLEDWKRVVPYRTVDDWAARETKKTPASVKQYMKDAYFAGQWQEAYDPLLDIQAGWAVGPNAAWMARVSALTYDMIFTQPVLYEFPDLKMPVLLIIGQRDRTALGKNDVPEKVAETLGDYPELGRKAKAAIPDATLVELADIGHVPMYEDFAAFKSALLPFLDEHRPASKPQFRIGIGIGISKRIR
ncbi:MAG: alpha/beta hydrolase [Deltaproteobacteria bacterium]|nr:alpha/beta hydrolase [Deltaproteobacteria bacterium]MCB9490057.1 alpha/beta hydrolase [Deltaproteobacteria bacterium]